MSNDIICWEEIIADKVQRMDLACTRCHHINVLVRGENLNCEKCGEQLLEFALEVETAEDKE